ncbi:MULTISPECIES: hypothetical protein [unclassified Streptomyces]|nr:hypothetical protein [Streptomyces sp. NBC_00401]MCX5085482.1 hypothetical protein [Streptomyces sp. NBC_00401]
MRNDIGRRQHDPGCVPNPARRVTDLSVYTPDDFSGELALDIFLDPA